MFEKYLHEDMEQALLTRLLSKPNEIWECQNLNENIFTNETHKQIFNAVFDQLKRGYPVNAQTIGNLLGDNKAKEYLLGLYGDFTTTKAKEYASYLAEEKEKYDALTALDDLLQRAEVDKKTDVFEELNSIATRNAENVLEISNDEIKKELERKMRGEEIGISTGIAEIDENINALQKGRLYIVGARPAIGKTAFMCSIINKIEPKHKVGVFSLEMTAGEIKQRLACLRQNIKHWLIEKGKCTQDEAIKYYAGLDSLNNVRICDKSGLNRFQLSAIARSMVVREKCEVLFVDHLGLIKTDNKGNLAHEIGENTTALKCLAKELKIPVVCLCQINRGVEQGADKKPRLSDLRDSGRIEEDADCVILLYRENYYNPQCDNEAEYRIAKCRNGKTDIVKGYFEGEYMRWS